MADMHTPLLIALNAEGDDRATMRLDDCPSIEDVIETLTEWMWTDPMRRLTIRAPSQDAETVKALEQQIATKDAALVEARTQVEVLQDRLGIKDPGCGTLSIIDAALSASLSASQKEHA